MSLSVEPSDTIIGGEFYVDFTPDELSIQSTAIDIFSWIIIALTVLLGVPGNGAVIWVTGFKMKRSAQTVCFLNLAVADLTYCLTLPFQLAARLVPSWGRSHLHHNFFFCAITLNLSASIFLMTVVGIFRCLAVTRPIWYRQHLRLVWVRVACFAAWVLAFLISLPELLIEQVTLELDHNDMVMLEVTSIVLSFVVPVAIIAACSLLMARKLCGEQFAQSRKPVLLIVTVVAAFIVCWLPENVFILLPVFSQPVPWEWMDVTIGLASFNSALNPFLYVFVGREFRQVFRRSFAASLCLAFAEDGVRVGERT